MLTSFQVIRNRESAQRSRNQRKQYLAGLEVRNRELEEEVRRLRGESPGVTPKPSPSTVASSTTALETSPEQTVLTLAGELGIPPQMVSSGVSLSSVAPPPHDAEPDVQVKQEFITAPALTNSEMDKLVSQNKALTQRVSILENLLKQVVAVSNLGGLQPIVTQPTPVDTLPVHQPASAVDETFDFNSFIQSSTSDTPPSPTTISAPITPSVSDQSPTSFYPVACHSAAVATIVSSEDPSDEGTAPQRARGNRNTLDSRLITRDRLDKVARILGALAKLRGWTLPTRSLAPTTHSATSKVAPVWDWDSRRTNINTSRRLRNKRALRLRARRGMRG